MQKALTVVLIALALVFVGCDDSDTDETPAPSPTAEPAAEIPTVEITKTDEGFDAPDSFPGGLTQIRVHNAGTRPYAVHFVRFTGDGTVEQFNDAIRLAATDFAASAAKIFRLAEAKGGTGSVAAGGASEVVLDLAPGRYVMVRYLIGIPDTREFNVTAAPAARPLPPESAFTTGMVEFAYEGFPDTLPAGRTTVEVVNNGEQVHVMEVSRVNEAGTTAEQVSQHLGGTPLPSAPSYTTSGGMGELPSGGSGWAILDLEPGVYTLTCWIFDAGDGGTGKLHVELGMHHSFTVQ